MVAVRFAINANPAHAKWFYSLWRLQAVPLQYFRRLSETQKTKEIKRTNETTAAESAAFRETIPSKIIEV